MFFYAQEQAGELCFYCNYGVYHGLRYDLLQYLAEYRRDATDSRAERYRRCFFFQCILFLPTMDLL